MIGNFLAVQWLGFHAFTAEGLGSIPDWGTKIPTSRTAKKKKKKQHDKRNHNCMPKMVSG